MITTADGRRFRKIGRIASEYIDRDWILFEHSAEDSSDVVLGVLHPQTGEFTTTDSEGPVDVLYGVLVTGKRGNTVVVDSELARPQAVEMTNALRHAGLNVSALPMSDPLIEPYT